jgi:hypothetical protein
MDDEQGRRHDRQEAPLDRMHEAAFRASRTARSL